MNILSLSKRCEVLNLLVEGNSLQSTSRITGVNINTVMSLLVRLGEAAKLYQDKVLIDLDCKRIECDEIWSFCQCRRYNVKPEHKGKLGYGDLWTWVAMDPDTRLIVTWLVGKRDLETGNDFIFDLQRRLKGRVQLSTDGFRAYKKSVDEAFGADVDFGMVIKIYDKNKTDPDTIRLFDKPGIHKARITGNPEAKKISTNLVERQNLTIRQSIKRFARRTNAFSKKYENHCHAVALHFLWYNFGRVHSTLRVTPAMEAGIVDHIWSLEEVIKLLG